MPQDNTQISTNQTAANTGAGQDVVVKPGAAPEVSGGASAQARSDMMSAVAAKIGESKNVLIALSGDPSVDELSAAIGLSLYMDRIGKRATAIYSGTTPNTLEFLKPEETFEPSADTLQDFVIAINKDKADHLRYKLDGNYVKMYITPYKHRLSEKDLEFSYGDYNVDLVLALDVANGIDLDSALREHGRIMHDAVIINVTTGNPGKFGELEWSDKHASSVSEMIVGLLYAYGGEAQIAKDEATAFLTGIVAATNRFSNAKTTADTMQMASRLMESGANQQLVSKNITPDVDNELFSLKGRKIEEVETEEEEEPEQKESEDDATKLDVVHDYERRAQENANDDRLKQDVDTAKPSMQNEMDEINADVTKKEHTLLDDLKAAEESLSHAGAETTPVSDGNKLTIKDGKEEADDEMKVSDASGVGNDAAKAGVLGGASTVAMEPVLPEPVMPLSVESQPEQVAPVSVASEPVAPTSLEPGPVAPEPVEAVPVGSEPVVRQSVMQKSAVTEPTMPEPVMPGMVETEVKEETIDKPETVIEPSAGFDAEASDESTNKYGQMLQEALEQASVTPTPMMASVPAGQMFANPAMASAPAVPTNPEINGVPEMNYMPLPGTEILPPPPAPVVGGMMPDTAQEMPTTAQPVSAPVAPQPVAPQTQPEVDPTAFRIPGM